MLSKQIPPLSTDERRFHDINVEEWVVQAGLGNFKRKQAGIFQKYVEQKMVFCKSRAVLPLGLLAQ